LQFNNTGTVLAVVGATSVALFAKVGTDHWTMAQRVALPEMRPELDDEPAQAMPKISCISWSADDTMFALGNSHDGILLMVEKEGATFTIADELLQEDRVGLEDHPLEKPVIAWGIRIYNKKKHNQFASFTREDGYIHIWQLLDTEGAESVEWKEVQALNTGMFDEGGDDLVDMSWNMRTGSLAIQRATKNPNPHMLATGNRHIQLWKKGKTDAGPLVKVPDVLPTEGRKIAWNPGGTIIASGYKSLEFFKQAGDQLVKTAKTFGPAVTEGFVDMQWLYGGVRICGVQQHATAVYVDIPDYYLSNCSINELCVLLILVKLVREGNKEFLQENKLSITNAISSFKNVGVCAALVDMFNLALQTGESDVKAGAAVSSSSLVTLTVPPASTAPGV